MTPDSLSSIQELVASVDIAGANAFTLNNHHVDVSEPASEPAAALVRRLQTELYVRAYCHAVTPANDAADARHDKSLTGELSLANTTKDALDHGWIVHAVMPDGRIRVTQNGGEQELLPGQFVAPPLSTALAPGVSIAVFHAREARSLQPGFYVAYGQVPMQFDPGCCLVRFYWNVQRSGAAPLIRELTHQLNARGVPFHVKCLNRASFFGRRDAAVLYVLKHHFHLLDDLIAAVHRRVREHLGTAVPIFTKRLADGLGVAEDPGRGESFGTNRCRLVAEGVWDAYQQGSVREFGIPAVLARFQRSGVDPTRPHLRARSRDIYSLEAS
jgi:hypothetical protein